MTQKKLDKLQMRAYQVIDEIENKGDQRAKYQYGTAIDKSWRRPERPSKQRWAS